MFDIRQPDLLPESFGLAACDFIDTLKHHEFFQYRRGAMQLMAFVRGGDQIGGLNQIHNHQYILMSFSDGRISDGRMKALGFKSATRSNGSSFWKRDGIDCPGALSITMQEMTGLVV